MAKLMTMMMMLLASPAFADGREEAREHFQRGIKAYEVARYDEAIAEFSAAYMIKAEPGILFNLAQAYRLGGRRQDALRTYRMFLTKVPDAPNRHDIEVLIAELQQPRAPTMEDPDSELARRYYQGGAQKYDANEYDAAVVLFEKARTVKPAAALDFNIGRCHDRLGHTGEALLAYRRYLEARPEPNDAA